MARGIGQRRSGPVHRLAGQARTPFERPRRGSLGRVYAIAGHVSTGVGRRRAAAGGDLGLRMIDNRRKRTVILGLNVKTRRRACRRRLVPYSRTPRPPVDSPCH